MKFHVDYQYMRKDAARPQDDGVVIDLEFDSEAAGCVCLPNVGDFVHVDASSTGRRSFSGKVKSRAFFHILTQDFSHCHVNIVVEETDDDWGALIKE